MNQIRTVYPEEESPADVLTVMEDDRPWTAAYATPMGSVTKYNLPSAAVISPQAQGTMNMMLATSSQVAKSPDTKAKKAAWAMTTSPIAPSATAQVIEEPPPPQPAESVELIQGYKKKNHPLHKPADL